MKIKYLSDIHCEFHRDGGKGFIASLPNDGIRILVLAGDIATKRNLSDVLTQFSDRYHDVIYVPGNHEYYNSSWKQIQDIIKECCEKNTNLHYIDKEIVTIDGSRFIGATLWFPFDHENTKYKFNMSDFKVIKDFESWVYAENKSAVEFLENNLVEEDIVVTHYLPTPRSIHKLYENSEINRFFLCDVSELILERKPSIWIHGHTHHSFDYVFGETRIVCNPFGYASLQTNNMFDENVEIKIRGRNDS